MKFLKEFKEFAVKGNMMDMAIGIIIGASFKAVIDVLVKFVLMPPLSLMSSSVNFANRKIVLKEGSVDAVGAVISEEIAIGYGAFIEACIDFLIVGITIFIVVKFMNRLRAKSQDAKDKTVVTPKDIELLTQLTELMEEQNRLIKQNN